MGPVKEQPKRKQRKKIKKYQTIDPMGEFYALSKHQDIQILEVKDLLNEFANKEILQAAKEKVKEGYANFLVDLGGIEYMNSVGINFLIQLKKLAAEAKGKMVVAAASKKVLQLLTITKLTPLLNFADTVEQGLQEF
jgi:anti-sigma B factor antagonist